MQYKNLIPLFLLSISLAFFSTPVFSQNKNRIGFFIGADKSSTANVKPAFGISFERMVNKHNSAEIGIYYRTAIDDNLVIRIPAGANSSTSEQFFILEKFISIPLMYNYKSNTVNISIGASADIYAGWEEKKHVSNPPAAYAAPLQSYKFDNKVLWGAIAKISKTIKLSDRLVIEPYVYINPVFTSYSLYSGSFSETRQYYGAALMGKFIF
jgi:hypothetical protein